MNRQIALVFLVAACAVVHAQSEYWLQREHSEGTHHRQERHALCWSTYAKCCSGCENDQSDAQKEIDSFNDEMSNVNSEKDKFDKQTREATAKTGSQSRSIEETINLLTTMKNQCLAKNGRDSTQNENIITQHNKAIESLKKERDLIQKTTEERHAKTKQLEKEIENLYKQIDTVNAEVRKQKTDFGKVLLLRQNLEKDNTQFLGTLQEKIKQQTEKSRNLKKEMVNYERRLIDFKAQLDMTVNNKKMMQTKIERNQKAKANCFADLNKAISTASAKTKPASEADNDDDDELIDDDLLE